ncbi:MAG: hypothetical protein WCO30_01765 [bacterium]
MKNVKKKPGEGYCPAEECQTCRDDTCKVWKEINAMTLDQRNYHFRQVKKAKARGENPVLAGEIFTLPTLLSATEKPPDSAGCIAPYNR